METEWRRVHFDCALPIVMVRLSRLASVQGKRDKLVGLKENVIVGCLISAGTGGAIQRVRRIAQDRDNVVIKARQDETAAAAALAAAFADDCVIDSDLNDVFESRN